MRFSTVFAALVSVGVVSAQSTTHTIIVGANNGTAFNPTSVNASVGDTIAFQFQGKNHTVTQSTFTAPCQNMTTPTQGVDSGFQFVPNNATEFPQWSFTMTNASAPLWFYCRQANHCQMGMVFAVNPTAAKSFDAFQAAAKASTSSSSSAAAASGSSTSTPSASSSTANGAIRYSGSAASLLAVGGVVAGLLL